MTGKNIFGRSSFVEAEAESNMKRKLLWGIILITSIPVCMIRGDWEGVLAILIIFLVPHAFMGAGIAIGALVFIDWWYNIDLIAILRGLA